MKKVFLAMCIFITQFAFAQTQSLDSFINEWIGKPYKFGGKTKSGIDCSQFTKRLYNDVYGLELRGTCSRQWNQTIRVSKTDLQEGDIVFFKSRLSPSGWHCGLYIGNNKFVHASNKFEGVKISSLSEDIYRKNYKGAGRLM